MKNSIIVWLCLSPVIAMAQIDSLPKKLTYYNSFVSGVMIGSSDDADEKEFSLSFLTTHGVKFYSGVKIGIGVGVDTYYNLKVFPLVLSLTVDQERKKNALFAQLNGGYSFVRYTREPDFAEIDVEERGGLTINPMIGYRIMADRMRIYVLAGYKYQAAELRYNYPDWWGASQASRQYELNRFVIQLGFGLE